MTSAPAVLVVEDDADVRSLVVFALERLGLRVRAEDDGATGLAAALAGEFDLIVLDWMMPGLDGLEVCRRLRATPRTARIPVPMLTAVARPDDADGALTAGADAYISKPFTREELGDTIRALLARSLDARTPRGG